MHDTKICTKCQQEKSVEEFRFRNKSKGTRAPWCKLCFGDYERNKWQESPERRDGNKSHNKERRNRNRQFVWDYLRQNPCVICNEDDPRVLEFDHLDPKVKSYNISDICKRSYSIDSIKAEIAKCRILCANCHRRHTYEQQGWKCY